jgi:hypothetical protein
MISHRATSLRQGYGTAGREHREWFIFPLIGRSTTKCWRINSDRGKEHPAIAKIGVLRYKSIC